MLVIGLLATVMGILTYLEPRVIGWPAVVMCLWIGLSFMAEGLGVWRKRKDLP